jgi:prevent-host-death family protein
MSITVNVQEAKTRLSELLHKVQSGEDVIIARAGKPIAHLEPAQPRQPVFGGIIEGLTVPDEFFDELPESELAAWEGNTE